MLSTMQDVPLTVPLILRRVTRFFPEKRVVTGGLGGPFRHTWGQVAARSNQLVHALRKLGVAPGERVGTLAWNNFRHLELYYAVPSMGAVLHTVNMRLSADQLVYVINHAEDQVLFVDSSLSPMVANVRGQLKTVRAVVVMDDGSARAPALADPLDYERLISGHPTEAKLPEVEERSAAAMCYTSGTTGEPKGVVYSHRSTVLHSLSLLNTDALGLSERDTVMPFVPMFHVNAWGVPYAAGLSGSNLVLPGNDLSPKALADLIQNEKVTVALGVPTLWNGVDQVLAAGQHDFSHVRYLLSGGAALSEGLIRRYAARGISIRQGWGMTETSPVCNVFQIRTELAGRPQDELLSLHTSVGLAAPGVELRLLAEDGSEVPWDGRSVGELEVRGPWITGSYYRPEDDSNRARFHDGWLRTGDVATLDPLGYLRIVDRTKDLVKSGGEWISSVELEARLMAHPAVLEAAVIALPHPKWDERPLAVVVKRPQHEVTAEALRLFLEQHFPKWWLPDAFEFSTEVPKTSVGKFDKKRLRAQHEGYRWP